VANAKSSEQRHHNAYYLFETSLKLAASAQVGAYLSGEQRSESIDKALEALALPAAGHWLGFLREISSYRASLPDAARIPLGEVGRELKAKRRSLAACRELAAAATEVTRVKPWTPKAPSVLDLFSVLVEYRNEVFGHAAARSSAFYARMGHLLVGALLEVLEQVDLFGGLKLALARVAAGEREGQLGIAWFGLVGLYSLRLKPAGEGWDEGCVPGQLYLVGRNARVPLYPLVVYAEDELERERVGFLNRVVERSRKGDRVVRRVEYLDYSSGETLRQVDAQKAVAAVLSRVRGQKVDSEQLSVIQERTTVEPGEVPEAEVASGAILGDFEILGELGSGGMGVVYHARQRSLNREVALKVLPPAMSADPVALARFRREVTALGRCDHPNLVRVLAAGKVGETHYYAMEYISGTDLAGIYEVLSSWQHSGAKLHGGHLTAAVSSSSDLALKRREGLPDVEKVKPGPPPKLEEGESYYIRLARLTVETAQGVAHLHENGVIHRDIKPGNVMVTRDGRRAVVMDLGLAQTADRSMSLTLSNVKVLGTLRYMAPEQLQRQLMEVDHRADIYALGATLYELACLRPVYSGEGQQELIKQKLLDEPEPPLKANPRLPRDLATIIEVTLQRRPQDRYQSAADLATDLRAFANGEPIQARPSSLWTRTKRRVLRHKAIAAVVCGAFVLTIALVTGWVITLQRRTRQAQQAAGAARKAERQAQRERARAQALARKESTVRVCIKARQFSDTPLLRMIQWNAERGIAHPKLIIGGRDHPVSCFAFSRDGALLASGCLDNTIRLWDTATGKQIVLLKGHEGPVRTLAFGPPDGKLLASGGGDDTIRLWDVGTGKEILPPRNHEGSVASVAFSPDGKLLALAGSAGVSLLDVPTRKSVSTLSRDHSSCVAFSPDGKLLAAECRNRTVVWDVAARKETFSVRWEGAARKGPSNDGRGTRTVRWLAFSPDGKVLASAGPWGTQLWRVGAWSEGRTLMEAFSTVAFSPDSDLMASEGDRHTIRLWDVKTGEETLTVVGPPGDIRSIAFSPDGTTLAAGSAETIELWRIRIGRATRTLRAKGRSGQSIRSVAFSRDGKLLAAAGHTAIGLWDVAGGQEVHRPPHHDLDVICVAFSPDGKFLASADDDTIRLWDATTWERRHSLGGHRSGITSLAFSPDGRLLASGARDKTIRLWDVATGEEILASRIREGGVEALAFSPDGKHIASAIGGGWGESIAIWDAATGKRGLAFGGDDAQVYSLAFSPDGKLLASGASDRTIKLWDLATGKAISTLSGHTGEVRAVAFRPPGGKVVASGSLDGAIRLWDLATGETILTLLSHEEGVESVAFSPDGKLLGSGSRERTIKLWDVDPAHNPELRVGEPSD